MTLSKKQNNELIVWKYFIPKNCQWTEKTDKDIEMFFEWSEKGKHKDITLIPTFQKEGRTYFHALYYGKKRAGIHIHEMWEPTIGETISYRELLEGMPREVVDFIKKEVFKGIDSEIIELSYNKNVLA